MDHFDSLKLNCNEHNSKTKLDRSNEDITSDDSNESDYSDMSGRRNLNNDINKDENKKVEKYIKLENTAKIWAGSNEIIHYEKKKLLEFDKMIFTYESKEINVSSNSKTLIVNNNNLDNLNFLNDLLKHLFQLKNIETVSNYSNLISLDLSFNNLTTVSDNLFVLSNLKILFLHSNKIENITEIQKLTNLSKLKKLTLENNPLMEMYNKFYRSFIIHYLPQIKSLDFHDISKVEKNKSDISFNTHKYKFNLS